MTTSALSRRAARFFAALIPMEERLAGKRDVSGKFKWSKPLAILCCLVNSGSAGEFGIFTYTQPPYPNSNEEVTITRCFKGAEGAVSVPATINGIPVKRIAPQAFYECNRVTSVTMPNSVISIGDGAFAYCYVMTGITLPSNITSIGYATFASCQSLNNVTIPNAVTSIGSDAFRNCFNLTTVTIPASVTSIGYTAFGGCGGMSSISVHPVNPNYSSDDGILFDKLKTTLIQCPAGKVGIGDYVIPDSVTSIANSAFARCSSLTGVTIPPGVTIIPNVAFQSCGNLTTVTIPETVNYISNGAFQYCYNLTNVTLPAALIYIDGYAFANCSSLTEVTIPSGVTAINDHAFEGCQFLKKATFMGNAPLMQGPSVFASTAVGFKLYFLNGASGFTTPTWESYPALLGVPPQFTGVTAPATGKVGAAYNHTFTATGIPDATFALSSGALPDGVSISAAGLISGIPTIAGIFTGTVTASNGIPPDATQTFTIDTNEYRSLTTGGNNGIVTGGAIYLLNATASLTATPSAGYLFTEWTGDATGTDTPLSLLMNANKTVGASFTSDTNDNDDDGFTNYDEIVLHGTNPALPDTDGDYVKDSKDAFPLDPAETLDTDHDGTGDNADTDDDGDGYSDLDELSIYGTNPKRADSDGDGLSDPAEIQTHLTNPNIADTDNDGLSDGAEVNTYGSLPKVGDTDGDGFLDGYEVSTGKLPLDPLDKPALVAEARTAIEFTFPAAIGKIYRIEASTDLAAWSTVESGIAGAGGQVQRFYSTRNTPNRYFRVEEESP